MIIQKFMIIYVRGMQAKSTDEASSQIGCRRRQEKWVSHIFPQKCYLLCTFLRHQVYHFTLRLIPSDKRHRMLAHAPSLATNKIIKFISFASRNGMMNDRKIENESYVLLKM